VIKLLVVFFLITATFTGYSAELLIEWAKPLKKNLTSLNRREQGGVVSFRDDILVVTRSGKMHQFSEFGTLKKTIVFNGEFYFAPIVDKNEIFVPVSNSLILLDENFNKKWSVSGKAPIASPPLIDGNNIFIQFHDNSIYLIDRNTGEIKTTYTYYTTDEISFIRLSPPFFSGDKIVFSFSNGMVFYFALRKNSNTGTEELVPWYRIRTSGTQRSLEKKNFYDLLSVIPINEDTVLFSGGEYGGIISEGKAVQLKNIRNVNLTQKGDRSISGYGEGGIFLYGKDGINLLDEEGDSVQIPFRSENYVTNDISVGDYRVITTTGAGSMISYSEGHINLLTEDYSQTLYSIMVPNGVSAKGHFHNDAVYILSDMGVLYKLKVLK
jgi:hypothetical protein